MPLDLAEQGPGAAEYMALRVACGLSARTEEAAVRGLRGSLFAVTARVQGRLVGMGRVIGDGGSFAQITDIAVHPDVQGRGLGHRIVGHLVDWCERELPESCYLSLIADPPADRLYAKFGFEPALGMGRALR